eukprot:747923-Hanusia_phi.AAC.4
MKSNTNVGRVMTPTPSNIQSSAIGAAAVNIHCYYHATEAGLPVRCSVPRDGDRPGQATGPSCALSPALKPG